MSKFTPGPWRYNECADYRDGYIMAETKMVVNTSSSAGMNSEEAKANGILISKAPEMYEILKRILMEYADLIFTSREEIEDLLKEIDE